MNQNQFQNKSLLWIILTIEANIATIALFIGFSQLFFTFLPAGFLQNQLSKFFLSIVIILLLSVWSTRKGVAFVLKKTFIKQENIFKISFWVGFVPFLLGMGLLISGKALIPNFKLSGFIIEFVNSIFSAVSYGFFTYFWLKRLRPASSTPAVAASPTVSSQLKKGLIIGSILVAALITYAFLGQIFQQKAIEKIMRSGDRNEILNNSLKQLEQTSGLYSKLLSFEIIPSCRDKYSNTIYSVGAKAIAKGENLSKVELWLVPSGTGLNDILYTENETIKKDNQWETTLMRSGMWASNFYAIGYDMAGKYAGTMPIGPISEGQYPENCVK